MTKKEIRSGHAVHLRKQAEKIALGKATRSPENLAKMLPEEIMEMLSELQVHQIELEMQNEELRRAQEQRVAAGESFFDFYDLASVGYCTVSGKNIILEANLTTATLLGLPRSELVGKPISRFILKADQDIYYLQHKQIFDLTSADSTGSLRSGSVQPEQSPQACEIRMLKKDGSTFWARLEAIAVKDENGSPTCRIVISNIAESKRTEEDLVRSEEIFRLITENMMDCVSLVDVNGTYKYVSPSYRETLGYVPGDIIGITGFSLTHPDDLEKIVRLHLEGIEQGLREIIYQTRLRHKAGHYVPMEIRARALTGSDGKIIGGVFAGRDITSRKQAEDALHKSEEQLKLVVKGSTDAYWDWDLIKDEIFYSPLWWKQIGYTPDEIPSDSLLWEKLMHPDDRKIADKVFRGALKNGQEIYEAEFRLLHKDGYYVPVLSRGFITFNENKQPLRVSGTNMDLTSRKQVEEELKRHRDHLEEMVTDRTTELAIKNTTLQELNTTLKVLLKQREDDKKDTEEKFVMNVRNLVLPFVAQMKKGYLDAGQRLYLDIIEKYLQDIATPLMINIRQFNLTPMEIKVAALVKQGKSTKEVAELLGLAGSSIDVHRKNIRKKLGLGNKKASLQSYLGTLE